MLLVVVSATAFHCSCVEFKQQYNIAWQSHFSHTLCCWLCAWKVYVFSRKL